MDLYSFGEELYAEGKYKQAYEVFNKSLELGIDINSCLNYIGCCQMELGNYKEALEIFDKVIRNTTWERPVFNKGRVYLIMNKYSEALTHFNRAFMINPENEDCLYYLGLYYQKIEEYEDAKKYYKKSLSVNSKQPEVHLNLGIVFYRLNEFNKAIAEFDISLKDKSFEFDSLYNKGIVLQKQRRYNEALGCFYKAYKISQNDVGLMECIADAYFYKNEFPECQYWIDKALDIDPSDDSLLNKKRVVRKALEKDCHS